MLRVSFRNDYGSPADALLIALDGVPKYLRCAAPQNRGPVLAERLGPGVHHVDVVYNFGPGRAGRTPYAFKMKPGSALSITVVLDRDEHEHPTASIESTRGDSTLPSPASHAKEEAARRACLEKCRHQSFNADCADENGMMPCPCNCD